MSQMYMNIRNLDILRGFRCDSARILTCPLGTSWRCILSYASEGLKRWCPWDWNSRSFWSISRILLLFFVLSKLAVFNMAWEDDKVDV